MTKSNLPTFAEYDTFLKKSADLISLKNRSFYAKKFKAITQALNALPCAVYMLDYQTKQYLFVSKSCEKIIGYTAKEIIRDGNELYVSKLHPADLEIYSSKVFKKFIFYTNSLPANEIKNVRFSFNYRFKRKDGQYIHILQQFEILEVNEHNYPVLVLGFITDITPHKNDNKVTYAISTYSKKTGFNRVTTDTFPNIDFAVSSREKDIINELIKGLSSKEIATKLHISLHTVSAHRRNILKKVHCKNTSELISYSIANGIV
jgi:PAS domain S-box-containing protein